MIVMYVAYRRALMLLTVSSNYVVALSEVGDDIIGHRSLQAPFLPHPEQARAIKDAYTSSWGAYSKFAFGSDELLPISEKGNVTK